MAKQPVISFKGFSFQYFSQSEPTLHDINLDIYGNEILALLGDNGAGTNGTLIESRLCAINRFARAMEGPQP